MAFRFVDTAAKIAAAAVLASIAAIASSTAAHAQYGLTFGTFRPGPGDAQIVGDRGRSLLDGPSDPRAVEWENARTGNRGTITLMNEVARRGQQCRQLEYRTLGRASAQPEVVILLWCRGSDGRWRIFG